LSHIDNFKKFGDLSSCVIFIDQLGGHAPFDRRNEHKSECYGHGSATWAHFEVRVRFFWHILLEYWYGRQRNGEYWNNLIRSPINQLNVLSRSRCAFWTATPATRPTTSWPPIPSNRRNSLTTSTPSTRTCWFPISETAPICRGTMTDMYRPGPRRPSVSPAAASTAKDCRIFWPRASIGARPSSPPYQLWP